MSSYCSKAGFELLLCKKFKTAVLNSFAFSMEQTCPHFLIIWSVDFERYVATFFVPDKKHLSSSPETKKILMLRSFKELHNERNDL